MKPEILHTGIGSDVLFGNNVKVIMPVNLYGCQIGNDCFIGPFTEITNNVSIGDRTRIQSHSFVCDFVSIGTDCFIGHGVMFINDKFSKGSPARGDKSLWLETSVGNNVSIGSNATILPIHICDRVVIGAGAVVTENITVPGFYAGNPAKFIREMSDRG